MPLPLEHTVIGLAVYGMCSKKIKKIFSFPRIIFIAVLSNFPDIDVLLGLILRGDPRIYHRFFTHGIIFALIAGFFFYLFSEKLKLEIDLFSCLLISLSHIVADFSFYLFNCFDYMHSIASWLSEDCIIFNYKSWGDVIKLCFIVSPQGLRIVFWFLFALLFKMFVKKIIIIFNARKTEI